MVNELELNLTKEDMDFVTTDPRLGKIYKQMQAGFTQKTQELAEGRRESENQLASLQQEVTARDEALQEWEDWFAKADEGGLFNTQATNQQPTQTTNKGDNMPNQQREPTIQDLVAFINKLNQALLNAQDQIEKRFTSINKMFDYSLQLGDLKAKYPDIDAKKVLETALAKGVANLEDAYDATYRDDIIKRQVEEQLTPRLEQEMAKRSTSVETGSGTQTSQFKRPEKVAKTFAEGSRQILDAHAGKGGGVPPPAPSPAVTSLTPAPAATQQTGGTT